MDNPQQYLVNLLNAIILTAAEKEFDNRHPREPDRKAEDDAPLDVQIGDLVYLYDEDDCELKTCKVVTKYENHHYALFEWSDRPPSLEAVSVKWFYRTPEEAAEVQRESIEYSVKYHEEYYNKSKAVRKFLA